MAVTVWAKAATVPYESSSLIGSMARHNHEQFADLTFDDLRRMVADDALSPYEKIGFPDEYREGAEAAIFRDITAKLRLTTRTTWLCSMMALGAVSCRG
jgi:hypothetical protein